MRHIIRTADVLNLETINLKEDGTEERKITIRPNVEGQNDFTIATLQMLMRRVLPMESRADIRLIVLISAELGGLFSSDELVNYFDPCELHEDVKAGCFGYILGLPVVLNDKTPGPCLAVASVHDGEDGSTILDFAASEIKL